MKKYCEACKQKIKGNDFVEMIRLNNPLLTGYWCRSCFLAAMYDMLEGVRMDINLILARLDLPVNKEYCGERGDGKEGDSTTHL